MKSESSWGKKVSNGDELSRKNSNSMKKFAYFWPTFLFYE